jgi:hypothetical protein
VIYYQIVQLVIFLPTFNAPYMRLKINVMEREWKNLEFRKEENKAQHGIPNSLKAQPNSVHKLKVQKNPENKE